MSYPHFRVDSGRPRWFDGGPRRLWGLMMTGAALIAGMFLGRFLTQSEMQRAVAQLKARISDREIEISMLRHEALQPPPQQLQLDQLLAEHEQLQEQHRQLAVQMGEINRASAVRQDLIGQAIHDTESDKQICLDELHRFDQSVPVEDVLGFAESMFDARRRSLEVLAAPVPPQDQIDHSGADVPVAFLTGREGGADDSRLRGALASDAAARTTRSNRFAQTATDQCPVGTSGAEVESIRDAGIFFNPPRNRPTGYTYCTPREGSRVAGAQRSRIVFSENNGDTPGPVSR